MELDTCECGSSVVSLLGVACLGPSYVSNSWIKNLISWLYPLIVVAVN